jgi:hypothetical protein
VSLFRLLSNKWPPHQGSDGDFDPVSLVGEREGNITVNQPTKGKYDNETGSGDEVGLQLVTELNARRSMLPLQPLIAASSATTFARRP